MDPPGRLGFWQIGGGGGGGPPIPGKSGVTAWGRGWTPDFRQIGGGGGGGPPISGKSGVGPPPPIPGKSGVGVGVGIGGSAALLHLMAEFMSPR